MDAFIDPFEQQVPGSDISIQLQLLRMEEMDKDLKEKIEELISHQKVLEERLTQHYHDFQWYTGPYQIRTTLPTGPAKF